MAMVVAMAGMAAAVAVVATEGRGAGAQKPQPLIPAPSVISLRLAAAQHDAGRKL